jgi:hypothetical protein
MVDTWGNGSLKYMYRNYDDIEYGFEAISEGYSLLKNKSIFVQYENLVNDPKYWIESICEYLDIEYEEEMLAMPSSNMLKGSLGDKSGVQKYNSISSVSLDKWKYTFNTFYRKKYLSRIVKRINSESFLVQGYNKSEILDSIDRVNASFDIPISDFYYSLYGNVVRHINPRVWSFMDSRKSNYLS